MLSPPAGSTSGLCLTNKEKEMGRATIWSVTLSLALAGAAGAAPTPQDKCIAGKSKAAGKYYNCLQKAVAKLVTTGHGAEYNETIARCQSKFIEAWNRE